MKSEKVRMSTHDGCIKQEVGVTREACYSFTQSKMIERGLIGLEKSWLQWIIGRKADFEHPIGSKQAVLSTTLPWCCWVGCAPPPRTLLNITLMTQPLSLGAQGLAQVASLRLSFGNLPPPP